MTGSFEEVLDDPSITDVGRVKRLVFCSGKISHDAIARRDSLGVPAAIIRLEQLYPFPRARIRELLQRYDNASDVVWLQEEPDNMGPRSFVGERLWPMVPEGVKYTEVSRVGSGSPACGSHTIHTQEQDEILKRAFDGL